MAHEVLVPPLGQTVDTVVLVTWYRQEGETVVRGEPLFAIETDKATLDVEAPASGVLGGVSAQPGDQLEVLSTIALITAPGEAVTIRQPVAPAEPAPSDTPQPHGDRPSQGPVGGKSRIFISPRARRVAEEHRIPLEVLSATGPQGAIVERDVRAYLAAQALPPAPPKPEPLITPVARRLAEEAGMDWRQLSGSGSGGRITRDDVDQVLQAVPPAVEPITAELNEVVEAVPLRGVRAVIAERMAHSASTTAHVTLMAEADATALVELRHQLIQDGLEVAYNELFLYILARALREHPQLNASLEGDVVRLWRRIHIGLAVDTDRGLLVPVLRDVDRQGLRQLVEEVGPLVTRARASRCTPDELRGGTFTLTNLGMFGIDAFTPLINLPECAILGVGRIKKQPVMMGDAVVGRHMVWLSLTFDHRLVDGAPAARFLQRVVQLVERPHLLLV